VIHWLAVCQRGVGRLARQWDPVMCVGLYLSLFTSRSVDFTESAASKRHSFMPSHRRGGGGQLEFRVTSANRQFITSPHGHQMSAVGSTVMIAGFYTIIRPK